MEKRSKEQIRKIILDGNYDGRKDNRLTNEAYNLANEFISFCELNKDVYEMALKRREIIIKMKNTGIRFKDIGVIFNISRTMADYIFKFEPLTIQPIKDRSYKKPRRTKNTIKKYLASQKHRTKYPQKTEARRLMTSAIRRGKLKRKPCQVCGLKKVDGHHPDYSRPLFIMWLCRKHHAEWHKNHRQK